MRMINISITNLKTVKWNYRSTAQASLEMTAAMILAAILLAASVRLFVWLNGTLMGQCSHYESTSYAAGSAPFSPVTLSSPASTAGAYEANDWFNRPLKLVK